jgi:phosphopantothenoylcysteine decarboxylase / phosphopantothenate---cysteine ligase
MGLLSGKKILLGISGGIAAYKTPFLVRQIVQHGAEVKVVMTPSAKDFVTPLTLATLSKNPVLSTFTATDLDNPVWNDHVELALWADLMLIAPATSNTLSSMVQGRCNNLLLAVYLSSKCPVFVAPAMDLDMYSHPSNKRNLEGFLASGLEGKGRMMEPEEIVSKIVDFFNPSLPLKGKKVLITAGPTYEAIDPVRFIGNHASGKMGFALAEVAAQHGAEVILISGPTHEKINHPSILLEKVISAEEMFTSVKKHYPQVAIAIAAAAVADFKPKNSAKQKIKKQQGLESIPMIPTVDILAYMGEHKSGQFLLGFALETENELENAKNKLTQKNLDGIVLNSLRDPESGFTVSTNKITYIDANSTVKEFPLQSKLDCAKTIFGQILKP